MLCLFEGFFLYQLRYEPEKKKKLMFALLPLPPLRRLSWLHKWTLSALHGVLPDCGECVFMVPCNAVCVSCLFGWV